MESYIASDPGSKMKKFFLVFIVGAVLLLIGSLLWLFHLYSNTPKKSIVQQSSQLSPTATPSSGIDCDMGRQKYKEIIQPEATVSGVTVGTLKGIATQVVYHPQTTRSSFQLTPIQGGMTYDFSIRDHDVSIANNSIGAYEDSLSTLAVGELITLSYNCDPNSGNKMVFVSLSHSQ